MLYRNVYNSNRNLVIIYRRNNINILYCISISIALLLRWIGMDFISGDMTNFLIPWYHAIKGNGGINSLSEQVGDYGLFYQTLISFMTYISVKEIYLYKLLSVLFDFLLAYYGVRIYQMISEEEEAIERQKPFMSWMVFTVILFLPTIIVNSSYWGQCDSMYSTFCLCAIYYLRKQMRVVSMCFLGMAFACKLQSVFILPFVICYWYKKWGCKQFYIPMLAVLVFWLSGILAYIEGRDILDGFRIYFSQSNEYKIMYMFFPSFWGIAGTGLGNSLYDLLKIPAILISLCICVFLGWIYIYRYRRDAPKLFYMFCICFAWTLLLFLPSMRERYAYLLEVLFVIIGIYDLRYIKYAFLVEILAILGYASALFNADIPHCQVVKSMTFVMAYVFFLKHCLTLALGKKVNEATVSLCGFIRSKFALISFGR